MAGRGLRCPNRPRMSQIPGSNMDPKGVKYPYFTGRVSAPQSYIKQTGVNIVQALLSAESWAIRVCTLWLNKPRLLVLRVALVPCSQGWQAPHSSSFPWLGKKRVSLADTLERKSAVGSKLRTLLALNPTPENSSWTQQQQLWVPALPLKLSGPGRCNLK